MPPERARSGRSGSPRAAATGRCVETRRSAPPPRPARRRTCPGHVPPRPCAAPGPAGRRSARSRSGPGRSPRTGRTGCPPASPGSGGPAGCRSGSGTARLLDGFIGRSGRSGARASPTSGPPRPASLCARHASRSALWRRRPAVSHARRPAVIRGVDSRRSPARSRLADRAHPHPCAWLCQVPRLRDPEPPSATAAAPPGAGPAPRRQRDRQQRCGRTALTTRMHPTTSQLRDPRRVRTAPRRTARPRMSLARSPTRIGSPSSGQRRRDAQRRTSAPRGDGREGDPEQVPACQPAPRCPRPPPGGHVSTTPSDQRPRPRSRHGIASRRRPRGARHLPRPARRRPWETQRHDQDDPEERSTSADICEHQTDAPDDIRRHECAGVLVEVDGREPQSLTDPRRRLQAASLAVRAAPGLAGSLTHRPPAGLHHPARSRHRKGRPQDQRPRWQPGSSSLDPARCHALHEVALDEQVQDQDRDGRHDHDRHERRPVGARSLPPAGIGRGPAASASCPGRASG